MTKENAKRGFQIVKQLESIERTIQENDLDNDMSFYGEDDKDTKDYKSKVIELKKEFWQKKVDELEKELADL